MPPQRRDGQVIAEPGRLLISQERERLFARVLRHHGYARLEEARVFDAGCGDGYYLRLLIQWGATPGYLAGMDSDAAALEYARTHTAAGVRLHHGSPERVPEPDQSFDLSLAFSLFGSVRDEETAEAIAAELFRITRPGGLILVYDLRRSSPRHRGIHAIDVDDVHRWFPRCPMRRFTLTLPSLAAQVVGRYAPWLYGPLAALPPLRTHALYVLRRPALSPFPDTR